MSPSPDHGALYAMPLYSGYAGRFGLPILAEALGVNISLALASLGCSGNGIALSGSGMGKLDSLTVHSALMQ